MPRHTGRQHVPPLQMVPQEGEERGVRQLELGHGPQDHGGIRPRDGEEGRGLRQVTADDVKSRGRVGVPELSQRPQHMGRLAASQETRYLGLQEAIYQPVHSTVGSEHEPPEQRVAGRQAGQRA